jgi:lysophospholipid acyltransferase (LPLAT)-like uncharacterized protein
MGRWDRQLMPLPFCRIRLIEGKRQTMGARAPIRPVMADLQAELDRISELADRRRA